MKHISVGTALTQTEWESNTTHVNDDGSPLTTFNGNVIGNVTGNLTGNVSGTTITTTTINAPTGRTASYVIAASNSSATDKAQADKVCSGTSDQTIINDASLVMTSYNGGTIQLMNGDYYLSAPIIYYQYGCRIVGEGIYTVIHLSNGANCWAITDNQSASANWGLTLEDLTINANGSNQTIGGCVNLANMQNVTFSHCIFEYGYTGCVVGSVVNNSNIHDNTFCLSTVGTGFYLDGGGSSTGLVNISNNLFSQNALHGCQIDGSTGDMTLNGNSFWQNTQLGLYIHNSAGGSVTGGIVDGNGQSGIRILNSNYWNLSGVTDYNNGASANNSYDGIELNNSNYCSITGGCAMYASGANVQRIGVNIEGTSDYNTIIGVNVSGNAYAGGAANVNCASSGIHNVVRSCIGFNPYALINHPISSTSIGAAYSGTTVVASTTYSISYVDCFINTTDSSNNNCTVTIKSPDGTTIKTLSGAALPVTMIWLPIGYTINWGAFTGTPPSVTVFGN